MEADLHVTGDLVIPGGELRMSATRGGGPGGQHVNKVATRVEVRWDIAGSRVLDAARRARLLERLAPRLDRSGTLRIVAAEFRSQFRNRDAALQRLRGVVGAALREPKPRRRTRPTAASRERRLQEKRKRSERKQQRRTLDE